RLPRRLAHGLEEAVVRSPSRHGLLSAGPHPERGRHDLESSVQDGSGDRTVLAARRSQAHLWKAAAAIPVQHSARPCLCVAVGKNLIFAVGDRNYVQVLACTTAATLASTSPEDHSPGPAT